MRYLLYICIFISTCLVSSCVFLGKQVNGNDHVVKIERTISDFQAIRVEGSMNVYLTQGPLQPLQIEAEDNLMPYLVTEVDGDQLLIRTRDNFWLDNHKPISIYITAPNVDELHMTGSGDIVVQGKLTNSQQISLGVAGSGDIKLNLHTPYVKATIAGSGDIDVTGETKDMELSIAGSGDFNGQQLMAETVKAQITGSGNAHVFASEKIDASLIGSGDVYYQGDAQVNTHITGSGEVIKK